MKLLQITALKGHRSISPRQRLGYRRHKKYALKGQKHHIDKAFDLTGRGYVSPYTQGDALGLEHVALLGRCLMVKPKL